MTLKPRLTPATLAAILAMTLAAPGFAQDLDAAEALLSTDPLVADTDGDGQNDLADAAPTFLANPMALTGAAAPCVIREALVANNHDPVAKADATDHLELLVSITGPAALTGLSIHYSFTDADSGIVEASFRQLDGFEIPTGGEARLHIDDGVVPGHFRANPNSIYTTSQAAKSVSVVLMADGFAPVSVEIAKDAGGAEAAD